MTKFIQISQHQFLSLAKAVQATLIITGDNDLLVLNPYKGISMPARVFCQSLFYPKFLSTNKDTSFVFIPK